MKRKAFNPRVLVTFLMVGGFTVAAVTGIVLYLTPKGNIANWTQWTMAGLDKHQWADIHTVACTMFLLAGLLHIYFNWKPLKAFIYSRASQSLNRRWEMALAGLITGFVVFGTVAAVPPLDLILEGRDWAETELWVDRAAPSRPAGDHESALDQVAESVDAALAEVAAKSVQASQRKEAAMAEHDDHGTVGGGSESGGDSGGGGFGRLTVRDASFRFDLTYETVKTKLADAGIAFEEQESLRDIAGRHGMTPGDLGQVIRGGE